MDKCSCYYIQRYIKGWRNPSTPVYEREVGVCYGTKEKEECTCGGDRTKCDFYDYIKEKAQADKERKKVHEAIKFLTAIGYNVTKRSK
jgi:hypothetical protein